MEAVLTQSIASIFTYSYLLAICEEAVLRSMLPLRKISVFIYFVGGRWQGNVALGVCSFAISKNFAAPGISCFAP